MQAATVTALLNIRLCFGEDALSSSRCVVCFSVCPSLISHRPSFIADVLALFTAAFNRCLGCFESSHFDLLMRTAAHELRVTPRRAADIRARAALLVIVLEILALFIFDCVVPAAPPGKRLEWVSCDMKVIKVMKGIKKRR